MTPSSRRTDANRSQHAKNRGSAGSVAAIEASPVKSAERTVRILETLAAAPHRLSLAEMQDILGYPRSSLHALIRTLREMDWVESDESGSRFGIGPQALLTGTTYLDRDPALPYAHRVLEELRAEVQHTVHYARRTGASIIYLASRESLVEVRRIYRVGRKLPAHVTALGQALLAELTSEEVDEILPDPLPGMTENSITDRDELHAELERVRSRGWAFEVEQGTPGVACIARTVDYRIPATDAISCSMPVDAAVEPELTRMAKALTEQAGRLAASLRRAGVR